MIRLNCPGCGYGLQVKEAHTGKRGRCPKCNQVILVPMATTHSPQPTTPAKEEEEEVTFPEGEMRLKERPLDGPKAEATPPAWAVPEPPAPTPHEPKGLRKHPWPLDVILYPTSMSGLLNLAVFGGFLLLNVVMARVYSLYGGILRLIPGILITAYLTYYLAECVRDSADGGTRAPDNLTSMPDFKDASLQVQGLLLAALAFGMPAGLYALVRWRIDPMFWTLLGCAGFFFPMALLSVILFDSVSGLNPRYWLISVTRAFIPYLGLVLALTSIIAVTVWVVRSMAGFLLLALVILYMVMIGAHLLGRFYFRYERQIGWDI